MIEVGIARAFTKSPTPPIGDELKSLFWLHQTDAVNNPHLVIIKYWNQEANNGGGNWLAVAPDQRVFVTETLTVNANNQTIFTLANNVVEPQNTEVLLEFVPTPIYGIDFRITENGTNYNPNSINNNRLDFLGNEYGLKVGERVQIKYRIA